MRIEIVKEGEPWTVARNLLLPSQELLINTGCRLAPDNHIGTPPIAPGTNETSAEIGAPQEFRQREPIVVIGVKSTIETGQISAVRKVRYKPRGCIAQCRKTLRNGQVFSS